MEKIDPELQKGLNAGLLNFVRACDQIRDAATLFGLAASDLAFEIDKKGQQRACEAASTTIDQARK